MSFARGSLQAKKLYCFIQFLYINRRLYLFFASACVSLHPSHPLLVITNTMLIKLSARSFPRLAVSSLFSLLFIGYVLLNPEIFPILEHERVFHKPGAEIKHIHADLSDHAFFKHSCTPSKGTAVKAYIKLPIVTVFLFTAFFKFVESFTWSAFLFLLFVFAWYVQRYYTTTFLVCRARSPPLP